MGESSTDRRRLFTIGRLAWRSGVSVKTIRHYSDIGVLPPAERSPAGYRLYGDEHLVRLGLVRSLRSIGFDLATIGRIFENRVTVAGVAQLQLDALNLRLRSLMMQRVILRKAAEAGAGATIAMLDRLHMLTRFDRGERQRFLEEHLGVVLDHSTRRDTPSARWWQAICQALPAELTEPQMVAWLDLADLVSDDDFLRRIERQVRPFGDASSPDGVAGRTREVFERAAAAAGAGQSPRSASAGRIVRDFIELQALRMGRKADSSFTGWLLSHLEDTYDERVERFWKLMAALRGLEGAPGYAAGYRWLVEAMRFVSLEGAA